MALKVRRKNVFLYNRNVHVWNIKEGDRHRFRCLLKQPEIDVQSTSNRKLRTFYGKVTEFLNDDKITCLHGLGVIVIIELYRRVEQTVYLCNRIGYLCKSLTGGVYIYFLPYARGYDSILDDSKESLTEE